MKKKRSVVVERVRRNLEKMRGSIYATPKPASRVPGIHQDYVWMYGVTELGRGVILGPYANEAEAEVSASDLFDYRTYTLKTRNRVRATQEIKALLRKEGQSTDEAVGRKLHEKGLARVRTR